MSKLSILLKNSFKSLKPEPEGKYCTTTRINVWNKLLGTAPFSGGAGEPCPAAKRKQSRVTSCLSAATNWTYSADCFSYAAFGQTFLSAYNNFSRLREHLSTFKASVIKFPKTAPLPPIFFFFFDYFYQHRSTINNLLHRPLQHSHFPFLILHLSKSFVLQC